VSATAAVGNNVHRASRSAAAAFFARIDVRRAAATMAGAAMLSCWQLREQMLDDATRGGGGGRREASSSLLRTMTMDGIFPRRRRDGDGCGDAAVPSDRRRRQLRRGRGTTRHDERGGGDDKGRERVESDEGATRWRRTAAEVRVEEAACREVSIRDVERAYQKMSAAEKDIFKKKMAEIDEADDGVDEESPPTPTPV
jgi:hypothetical protein